MVCLVYSSQYWSHLFVFYHSFSIFKDFCWTTFNNFKDQFIVKVSVQVQNYQKYACPCVRCVCVPSFLAASFFRFMGGFFSFLCSYSLGQASLKPFSFTKRAVWPRMCARHMRACSCWECRWETGRGSPLWCEASKQGAPPWGQRQIRGNMDEVSHRMMSELVKMLSQTSLFLVILYFITWLASLIPAERSHGHCRRLRHAEKTLSVCGYHLFIVDEISILLQNIRVSGLSVWVMLFWPLKTLLLCD